MIKGLIFDLDGTTLDTVLDLQKAISLATNTKQSYDDVKNKTGNGFRKLVERCLDNASEEEIDKYLKRFVEEYDKCYKENTRPYAGIPELLKELNNKNILIGINSNKNDLYTKELIRTLFKDIVFVDVLGSRVNIPNKPDPTSANELIEKMKLTKEEVMYVGDSETDIKTAINANLKSIGCTWGFRDEATIKKAGADYIASKPSDILKIINL